VEKTAGELLINVRPQNSGAGDATHETAWLVTQYHHYHHHYEL